MSIEKYPHHCTRCGAPLTQVNEDIFCEYCGQKYTFISEKDEVNNTEEQQDEELLSNGEQSRSKNAAPATSAMRNTSNYDDYNAKGCLYIVIITIILSIIQLCHTLTKTSSKTNSNIPSINLHITQTHDANKRWLTKEAFAQKATKRAINKPSRIELIYRDLYSEVIFPAAGNEDLPVATVMVLEYADANHLIFSLFVHNQSGKDIDTSSLQEHLEIDSLTVTSDLEDEFICSLKKDNWDEDLFLKNQIRHKGMVNCSGSLNPESSLIVIDFDMPNWGSSHLEIPIQADNEDLQSNIEIELAPENYSISAELHSDQPQLVWVKKSDIAINDDRGITLSVDGCTPITSQQGAGEYFLTLTYPSGYDERLYDEKLITCKYDEPFPSEVNTMSASMKTTSGKTFSSQAVINLSTGSIEFSNQP